MRLPISIKLCDRTLFDGRGFGQERILNFVIDITAFITAPRAKFIPEKNIANVAAFEF